MLEDAEGEQRCLDIGRRRRRCERRRRLATKAQLECPADADDLVLVPAEAVAARARGRRRPGAEGRRRQRHQAGLPEPAQAAAVDRQLPPVDAGEIVEEADRVRVDVERDLDVAGADRRERGQRGPHRGGRRQLTAGAVGERGDGDRRRRLAAEPERERPAVGVDANLLDLATGGHVEPGDGAVGDHGGAAVGVPRVVDVEGVAAITAADDDERGDAVGAALVGGRQRSPDRSRAARCRR